MKNQFILNDANYHSIEANQRYFSASQVKSFYSCEARTMAMIEGKYVPEESVSLLIGSYVDAYFNAKRCGDAKGQISGPEFNEFIEKNRKKLINSRTGELKADFRLAEQMIERAESDPVFMRFLKGNRQTIMTATLFGVPFKVKFDVLRDSYRVNDKRIVDVKTVKDFKPMYREGEGRLSFIEYWKYDLQMAIYQAVYEHRKGIKLPMYLACITKENPSDIGLFHIPQEQIDMNLKLLEQDIERFRMVKAGILEPHRCENCAYCRATRKLTGPISMAELNMDMVV